MITQPAIEPGDLQSACAYLALFARRDQDGMAELLRRARDEDRMIQLLSSVVSVIAKLAPNIYQSADAFADLAAQCAGFEAKSAS